MALHFGDFAADLESRSSGKGRRRFRSVRRRSSSSSCSCGAGLGRCPRRRSVTALAADGRLGVEPHHAGQRASNGARRPCTRAPLRPDGLRLLATPSAEMRRGRRRRSARFGTSEAPPSVPGRSRDRTPGRGEPAGATGRGRGLVRVTDSLAPPRPDRGRGREGNPRGPGQQERDLPRRREDLLAAPPGGRGRDPARPGPRDLSRPAPRLDADRSRQVTSPTPANQGTAVLPGTRLGPYEVLAPLGAGGMGEVYRARDARLGREVAVKVLPAQSATDPDRLRRFEQEAKAAGALNHPNLLTVFDTGQHDGNPYVVFELLDGTTLRQVVGRAPCRPARRWSTRVQIAQGLAAAHEQGDRPPRPQAREPVRDQGRAGEDPRLRPRQAPAGVRSARSARGGRDDFDRDRRRRRPRHRRLHVARAGQGRSGRPSVRHLRLRVGVPRDAVGRAAVQGRDHRRGDDGDPQAGLTRSWRSPTFLPGSSGW